MPLARSRAERAASPRAPISLVVAFAGKNDGSADERLPDAALVPEDRVPLRPRSSSPGEPDRRGGPDRAVPGAWYAMLPIPSAGDVTLGFEFARRADAAVADRLPPALARHAAVALALVTDARRPSASSLRCARTKPSGTSSSRPSPMSCGRRSPAWRLPRADPRPAGRRPEVVERSSSSGAATIVGSMAELVGDLLELSRLESGSLVLGHGPFSVADAAPRRGAG